jgi:hypothetical protein
MKLRQVIYASTGTRKFSDDDLNEILESSQRHNLKNDITGVLFYLEGNFLQLFEGGEAEVEETFDWIKADERHTGLLTLVDEPVEERLFHDWRMGFVRADESILEAHNNIFRYDGKRWEILPSAGFDQVRRVMFETFFTLNNRRV